jgi:hypothetical protein
VDVLRPVIGWWIPTLVAGLLSVGTLSACGDGSRRDSYVTANKRLLDRTPVYPRAQQVGTDQTVGYPKGNGQLFPENDSSGGYVTSRYFSVPSGGCTGILDWYDSQLTARGWSWVSGSGNDDLSYGKGPALIELRCGTESGHAFITMLADYKQRSAQGGPE